MPTHVAFLRAINVGGHTVKMEVLRMLFEELRLGDVRTFIASGNVLFTTRAKALPALERKIERHLLDALGYEVATFVRTTAEVTKLANATPFADVPARAGDRVHIGFLHTAPGAATRRTVAAFSNARDVLVVRGREVCWLSHGPISESTVNVKKLEQAIGAPTTMRNMTSIEKLAAKLS